MNLRTIYVLSLLTFIFSVVVTRACKDPGSSDNNDGDEERDGNNDDRSENPSVRPKDRSSRRAGARDRGTSSSDGPSTSLYLRETYTTDTPPRTTWIHGPCQGFLTGNLSPFVNTDFVPFRANTETDYGLHRDFSNFQHARETVRPVGVRYAEAETDSSMDGLNEAMQDILMDVAAMNLNADQVNVNYDLGNNLNAESSGYNNSRQLASNVYLHEQTIPVVQFPLLTEKLHDNMEMEFSEQELDRNDCLLLPAVSPRFSEPLPQTSGSAVIHEAFQRLYHAATRIVNSRLWYNHFAWIDRLHLRALRNLASSDEEDHRQLSVIHLNVQQVAEKIRSSSLDVVNYSHLSLECANWLVLQNSQFNALEYSLRLCFYRLLEFAKESGNSGMVANLMSIEEAFLLFLKDCLDVVSLTESLLRLLKNESSF